MENQLGPGEVMVMIGFTIAAIKVMFSPVGQALADRIRGRRDDAADPALVAEVDGLRSRLNEVEERLDFAERMLARAGQPDQIPGGAMR
jgi:hypothetical protein